MKAGKLRTYARIAEKENPLTEKLYARPASKGTVKEKKINMKAGKLRTYARIAEKENPLTEKLYARPAAKGKVKIPKDFIRTGEYPIYVYHAVTRLNRGSHGVNFVTEKSS